MNQGIILLARTRASDLDQPDWTKHQPADWQRFIPKQVRASWPTLSEECRAVAFLTVEAAANAVAEDRAAALSAAKRKRR